MLEPLLLMVFCLLMGLISLMVVVWLVFSGRLANLDGISLALISLTVGVFFLFNVGWSYRTGELRRLLDSLRNLSWKGRGKSEGNMSRD